MAVELPTEELLRAYRRDLHRIPETGFDLPKTISYVRDVLEGLEGPVEVLSPSQSCVCAFFDQGAETTVAIRADMDALPVTERSGVEFASTHEGRMHACGHDGHMAMVLGLARHLDACRERLPRNVLLVFQPAEETIGGSRLVCESGVLERYHVDRIFGFHLWPDLPFGEVFTRPGALLASASETTVTFHGVASHIAKPAEGRDSIAAACRFLPRSHELIRRLGREMDEPCLLGFGHMVGGQVRNQVAASTVLEGTLRTFTPTAGRIARRRIRELAQMCAEDFGCTATCHFADGYPPVTNDSALLGLVMEAVPDVEMLEEPQLIAEDFAFYQQSVPGVFMLLGTGTGVPLHADTFDFDESVLMRGLAVYERLVRME